MQLASRAYDVDDIMSLQELYHSRGWTDGMPIVPPTPDAVGACLEWALMTPRPADWYRAGSCSARHSGEGRD